MWEILKMIRVRANADFADYLLGIATTMISLSATSYDPRRYYHSCPLCKRIPSGAARSITATLDGA